ncbi:hypothetical protein PASE110613_09180 [Paenibacillus sediminis]|uniref:DUF5659 domain-containing protein n=1 Tax=Paenibacillus sediminis TaxID=664909 RepID=A0ABS4H6K8_9BACL|nr:hypothetical protein [Paenibacillus sediminis]MBP1938180.1 hypothetical protein [Paenibacillus sediminis]
MSNVYLYCYSPSMFHFLRTKGIRYICVGINEKTGGRFWLFAKDDAVKRALDEYDASK